MLPRGNKNLKIKLWPFFFFLRHWALNETLLLVFEMSLFASGLKFCYDQQLFTLAMISALFFSPPNESFQSNVFLCNCFHSMNLKFIQAVVCFGFRVYLQHRNVTIIQYCWGSRIICMPWQDLWKYYLQGRKRNQCVLLVPFSVSAANVCVGSPFGIDSHLKVHVLLRSLSSLVQELASTSLKRPPGRTRHVYRKDTRSICDVTSSRPLSGQWRGSIIRARNFSAQSGSLLLERGSALGHIRSYINRHELAVNSECPF